jgi:ribosomal protein S12 methylthiotransferase accessory factor
MSARSIDSLVSSLGVVGHVRRAPTPKGLTRLDLHFGSAGRLPAHGCAAPAEDTTGIGRVLDDPALSRTVAIAEAAERYAGERLHMPVTRAAMAELDGAVLDMSRIPRCSPAEYAHPGCRLVPFDENAVINWVMGVDLVSGRDLWVPAVMVSYGLHAAPQERFWYQISTGHAIHTDPRKALTGGILEVLERDSIALLWLQRFPLPPLAPQVLTEATRYLLDWSERHFIRAQLFDATTDLGAPTVYCLHVAEHDERARQVVSAASDVSIGIAAEKAMIEGLTIRTAFARDEPIPEDAGGIERVLDGARYMGVADRAGAFDFLLEGLDDRRPSAGPPDLPSDPGGLLGHLVDVLAEREMQVLAVDRTSSELADAGLTAATVVIPDLMPMSLLPYAQFRAHPRLYSAPARMGYHCHDEEELNPWPQPFA